MVKILVTGANGFIGSHIVEKLISNGYDTTGLVRKSSNLRFIQHMPVKLVYGDVTDLQSLTSAFEGIDIIIHNAGMASDWGNYQNFERVNVLGTKTVAEAALQKKIKNIVYLSSTAIHGFGSKSIMDESSPRNHKNFPYSKSKQIAEDFIMDFGENNSIDVTAIRPGNVYGPRDHTFMNKYAEAIQSGKAAVINHGSAKTCPTYVENLADAILLACFHPNAKNEAFIITDGLDITWSQFNSKIIQKLKYTKPLPSYPFHLAYGLGWALEYLFKLVKSKKPPLITTYRVQNGGLNYNFSIDKAKSMLGFEPKIGLDEAISRTLDWYIQSKND